MAPGLPGPPSEPVRAPRAEAAAARWADASASRSSSVASTSSSSGPVRPRRLDLVDLEGQHLDLPGPLPGVAPQALGLPKEAGQSGPGGIHRPRVDGPEGIQGPPLGLGHDQGAVLVLAVEFEQTGGGLAQGAHRAPCGRRPRPASGPPGPPSGPGTSSSPSTSAEPALDEGLVRPGPHHRRVGPPAQQQAEGPDQQRLSGPGLAGQGGHAGSEVDGHVVDDPEVAHVELHQQATHRDPTGRPGGTWPAGWRGSPGRRR